MVQWSTRLLPVMRDLGSIPRGVVKWNRDSPVSVVSLHWWPGHEWSLWPCLRWASSRTPQPSLGLHANKVIIPLDLTQLFCPGFYALCRSSFRLQNRHSRLLGGSPVESLQSHCICTQYHWSSDPPVCFPSWGTRFQSTGGYLCETGILLLALSC